MTAVLVVVGCGRRKLAVPAPVSELYTGSLFRMSREFAESTGHVWVVLSAKHGVVSPVTVLSPYDARLTRDLPGRHVEIWAAWCAKKIVRQYAPQHVMVLAGADYADPLCGQLDLLGVSWATPLARLGFGPRLRWLKTQREISGRVSAS